MMLSMRYQLNIVCNLNTNRAVYKSVLLGVLVTLLDGKIVLVGLSVALNTNYTISRTVTMEGTHFC